MIPEKLTIEGLYSYQQRQTIDFTQLTRAGLFGIFGTVGSGKSSILEAITYALYGETERLNARDKRTYNMMNLKSNRAWLELDFINFENKRYRATREFKRNSRRFEDVKPSSTVFYEYKDGNWVPLSHTDGEKIVGLSYTNFKRTIIIPQGQFKEFLELGAAERTGMMKEIFNLDRFDLQDKTAAFFKKNQSLLDILEGKLSGYQEVTAEAIEELKEKEEKEKVAHDRINREYETAHKTLQHLKILKVDFETLKKKKDEFEILQKKKPSFDLKQLELEKYEMVFNTFSQLLFEIDKKNVELEQQRLEEIKLTGRMASLEDELATITAKIQLLQNEYDTLPSKRNELEDLGVIVKIRKLKSEIGTLRERTRNGTTKVQEVDAAINTLTKEISTSEQQINELSAKRIHSEILLNVEGWFSTHKVLDNALQQQEQKTGVLKMKIADLLNEMKSSGISPENFQKDCEKKLEELEHQKKNFELQKQQHEVRKELSTYAQNLQDGSPCPLCGSTEHPAIVTFDDVEPVLISFNEKIKEVDTAKIELQSILNKGNSLITRKELLEKQLQDEEQLLLASKTQLQEHKSRFMWDTFDPNDPLGFEEKKLHSLQIDRKIEILNAENKKRRIVMEAERKNVEKYKQHLEQFRLDEKDREAKIEQNLEGLRILTYPVFEGETVESIAQKATELNGRIVMTDQQYQKLRERLNALTPEIASQKAVIELTHQRILETEKQVEALTSDVQNKLTLCKLSSLSEVHNILDLKLDINRTRKEITAFSIALNTLQNSVSELELKLKGLSFDEEEYTKTEESVKLLTNSLREVSGRLAIMKADAERLTKDFQIKVELENQQQQLLKRSENLKTLSNLFKGAGFVQYVSSIYLRQLCDHANTRFHRMTRNQLSLQLNESNDFEIIDYLNEGRSRSVKTLSGGQSFQVSLSLALALAESVHTHARASRNFFFIDEGFGTQDQESVNIVFETLSNLQKENRIVGIISHVEELKERIPYSLYIKKDEERGSLVELS